MNEQLPFDDLDPDAPYVDDPANATEAMLDTIAAVDFLRRGDCHGLTLWDAIEEAIRWWTAEHVATTAGVIDPDTADPRLGDPDPLRGTLTRLLATTSTEEPVHISVALHQALRRWTTTMAKTENDGEPWPHPLVRTDFPPPIDRTATTGSRGHSSR